MATKSGKVSKSFETILNSLLIAQNVIFTLKALGVDVDHLIGISNAQGPLAGQIKDAVQAAQTEHPTLSDTVPPPLTLPSKAKSKTKSSKKV